MSANVSIRLSVTDADKVSAAFDKIAADGETALRRLTVANGQLAISYDALDGSLNKVKSGNDNASNSYVNAVNTARDFSGGIAGTAENVLNTVNHLKLLALAAYALSPAFRSVTNVGIGMFFSEVSPLAAQATRSMLAFAGPALSFFGRLTGPIAIAVAAWEGMNYVIKTGSGLLDKYSGEVRSFFGSDVSDNLTKLTKLQPDDSITQTQIQYATELGGRLNTAKQTLSDFWKVQININDASLRLQSIWVNVVETIAKGTKAGAGFFDKIQDGATTFGNLPIWDKLSKLGEGLPGMGGLPGALRPSATGILPGGKPDTSDADEMAAARKSLAAGMGGGSATFPYKRYSQGIGDLELASRGAYKPDKDTKDTKDAYDRAVNAIERQNAKLIAETGTVNQNEAAHAALKDELLLLTAAKESDRGVTEKQLTEYERLRSSMTAEQALRASGITLKKDDVATFERLIQKTKEATQASAEAKLQSSIKFDKGLAGLNDSDQGIARQLVPLYGHDIPAALASTEAAQLRQLDAQNRTRQDIVSFSSTVSGDLTTAITNIVNGTDKASDGFRKLGLQVVAAIEQMILKMTIAEPVALALQKALLGAFGGVGGGIALPPEATGAGISPFAMGGIMSSRGALPLNFYASGGVASGAQMAIFGEGRQNEAYVPLPDGRAIPVNLKGGGGGGGVTVGSLVTVHVHAAGALDRGAIEKMVNTGSMHAVTMAAGLIRNSNESMNSRLMMNDARGIG